MRKKFLLGVAAVSFFMMETSRAGLIFPCLTAKDISVQSYWKEGTPNYWVHNHAPRTRIFAARYVGAIDEGYKFRFELIKDLGTRWRVAGKTSAHFAGKDFEALGCDTGKYFACLIELRDTAGSLGMFFPPEAPRIETSKAIVMNSPLNCGPVSRTSGFGVWLELDEMSIRERGELTATLKVQPALEVGTVEVAKRGYGLKARGSIPALELSGLTAFDLRGLGPDAKIQEFALSATEVVPEVGSPLLPIKITLNAYSASEGSEAPPAHWVGSQSFRFGVEVLPSSQGR